MTTKIKESYFLSQPHQPFFLLGIINAFVAILLFALNYKGIINLKIDTTIFHVYSIVYLVFTNLFVGFLFTTYSRFNQAPPIEKDYYVNLFYLNALGSILFYISSFIAHSFVVFAMAVLFVGNAFIVFKLHQIYKTGRATDKKDSFWILIAFYFGLLANFLLILGEFFPFIQLTAINMAFYLYLILLAFSVGQRMIPFFSHSFAIKSERFVEIVFALFILKVFFIVGEYKSLEIVTDLLLAGVLSRELLKWELHPLQSPSILWVLHLSLIWLPLAFFLSAISLALELYLGTSFYFFNLHLLALGFLTTVLIGFGTRVALGHSKQSPYDDKLASKMFIFVQFVVLARALFSINVAFGWGLDFLFDISFSLWLILFLVWGGRYFKVLVFGTKI